MGRQPTIQRLIYRHVAPETMVEALAQSGDYGMQTYPRSGYSFVSFSCGRPGVDSDAVRKVIAHCMDKATVISAYLNAPTRWWTAMTASVSGFTRW